MGIYDKLVDLFLDWNSKINLSAIRDKEGVKTKHINDSLEWLKVIEDLDWLRTDGDWWNSVWKRKINIITDSSNQITDNQSPKSSENSQISVVDVWTWSWFPVLPLAIEKPEWNFIWIESVRKKVDAVNDIIKQLWLKNIKIIWTRAENYKDKQFDILTARAVAYIDKLLKFTYHLVKKGWYFVLYKLNSPEEYEDIVKNCKKYNLELVEKYPYKLFEWDIDRMIYVLKKK